ncbi:MAG: hypothetical protein ABIJ15_04320 [bacterium]
MKEAALLIFAVLLFFTVRRGLNIFSGFFLILCFLLIVNPVFETKGGTSVSPLAVCMDVSSSMGVADCGGSRLDGAKKLVRDNLRWLKKHFLISFFVFGNGYRPVDEKEFFSCSARDDATDINGCISGISAGLPENAALLILSDGQENKSADYLFSRPVFSAGFGKSSGPGLLLKILSYPGQGFQGSSDEIKIKISRSGEVANFKILVREKGSIISEQQGIFAPDEFEKEMSVSFIPNVAGEKVKYTVEALSKGVNTGVSEIFRMPVFRSKIKVLFISGRPGWEYRNIRAFIKSSPKIDLTSFVILRNPEDYIPFPENKLSLIPFPVQEIFLKDIVNYDIVILLNFDYTRFIPEQHLNLLAEHVRKGGAFLLIGGENVFKNGNYVSSPLGGILNIPPAGESGYDAGQFFIKADVSHPVTSLIAGLPALSRAGIEGMNKISAVPSDAAVLLKTAGGAPVCFAREAGEGRVMVILTNGLWKLFFGNVETGYFYQEFFRNCFAWLTKSPLLEEISVAGRKSYAIGERVKLSVKVSGGQITVKHFSPAGVSYINPVMESANRFNISKNVFEKGEHRIVIEVSKDGRIRARKEFLFKVTGEKIEDLNTRSNFKMLENISSISGGKFAEYRDFGMSLLPAGSKSVNRFFPARSPYFMIVLVFASAALWWRENLK